MQKRAWYKKLDKTSLVGSRAQGALLFGILLVLTAVAVSSTPSSETKSESSTTSQAAMFSSIPARQGATSNNNTQINNSRNNRADPASGRDTLLSQRAQLGHNPEADGSDASTSSSTPQSKSATASERSSQTAASAADEIYQNPLEENRRIDAEARRRLQEAGNNSDSSAESFEEDSNAINGPQNSQLSSQLTNQFPGANSLSSAENQGNNSNGTISGISGTNSTKTIELAPAILNTHYCANVSTTTRSPTGTMKIASGFTPKGLLLNTTSGALCGTPNETGIFRFTVEERDLAGAGTNTNYRLVVKDEPTQAGDNEQLSTLEITTSSLEVGQVGAEYLQHLEGSGGKTPYSWLATDLPAGLELDQDSGIIAGSPTTAGESSVTVTLSDSSRDSSGTRTSRSLNLIIRVTPVFITTQALGEGVVGSLFQTRLTAQGGLPPYLWQLSGTPLPEGLSLNSSSGVIEGIPTESFTGALSVQVTDSEDKSDTALLALEIRQHQLKVVTSALSEAFINSSYSFSLFADGGTSPYRWSVTSGALPSGVSLSETGQLLGSPTSKGDFGFTVSVTDGDGQQASRSLKLRVTELATPSPTPTPVTTPAPSPEDPQNPGGDNSGGTQPTTPSPTPEFPPVSDLTGVSSNSKVGLSWENPVHSGFIRSVVVRTVGQPAFSILDGITIYRGTASNTVDLGLENGVTYSYKVFAEYAALPAAPVASTSLTLTPAAVSISSKPDPFVDKVTSFSPLDPGGCFNCGLVATLVLGPPKGSGENTGTTSDVVSLGAKVNSDNGRSAPYGGSITLEFTDNIVVNGQGVDLLIFENPFRISGTDDYFIEPAVVEVSADGKRFYRFPFNFVPHYSSDGTLNLFNPFSYSAGFAGVRPVYSNNNSPSPLLPSVAGGDGFDLSDLPGEPLAWARFVRITSTGDGWLSDEQGDLVRQSNRFPHLGASGVGNSGFDLDAAVAVNF